MSAKVRLDRAGMISMLNSPKVNAAVRKRAETMRSSIHAEAHDGPVPVEIDSLKAPFGNGYGVTLAHPGGIGLEAADGYLSEAASRAGLVAGRKRR